MSFTFTPRTLAVAILAAPFLLTGCNSNSTEGNLPSGGGSAATMTLTVTPSLGKISNARVRLVNAATKARIGPVQSLTAAGNGSVSFTVPQSRLVGQPVVAEVLPATSGNITYIDESDNLPHTLVVDPAKRDIPILHAAFNPIASTTAVGVTALTEAAWQQLPSTAMTAAQAMSKITAANAKVKSELQLGYDITTAPVLDYSKLVDSAIAQSQRAYAAYLAALAKQAAQLNAASTTPAYDIARSLAADLSDGSFNGAANGAALSLPYNTAFIQEWLKVAAAIVSKLSTWTNTAAFETWYAQTQQTIENAGGYNVPKILHPAMIRTYYGKVVSTTPTGIPARTPCTVTLNTSGVLSVGAAGQRYNVTIPSTIIDADSDMTRDGNRIKPAGTYMTTWGGRAHAGSYGIGWAHYTNSNTADGPVSTSVLSYANGSYGGTQLVCDTYSTTGGAASLGDGAYGAAEVGSDGSLVAASVKAELVTGGRKETWSDPAYGTLSVTYGASNRVISNITVTHGSSAFSCDSAAACSGAIFSGVNKVPSLVLNNVTLSGLGGKLNGVLVEAADAENPTSGNGGNTCSSNGADNTLGFTNAPTDFCSFTRSDSSAATLLPGKIAYTFTSATGDTAMVVVDNGTVTGVSLEKGGKYGFSCGTGIATHCANVTVSGATTTTITFNNTLLEGVTGSTSPLTVKNGSLIHQAATPAQLSVTGYSPSSAAIGATVVINGTGFDADATKMRVRFNGGADAGIISSSATALTVTVPQGAISGGVTVTNTTSGQTFTGGTFTVSAAGGGGLTFDSTACTANNFCGSTVMSDVPSLAMRQAGNNAACTLTKSGGSVTLSSGGKSLTTALDGSLGDTYTAISNVIAVNASNVSGQTLTGTIQIHTTNGVIDMATASSTAAGIALVCVTP